MRLPEMLELSAREWGAPVPLLRLPRRFFSYQRHAVRPP
jgi:hypothetical protein